MIGNHHASDRNVEHVGRSETTRILGCHGHAVRSSRVGCAAEGARRRVEAEPRRQHAAISQGGAVSQVVARIRVAERIGRDGIAERRALDGRLVRQRMRQLGRMVDGRPIINSDLEHVGHGQVARILCSDRHTEHPGRVGRAAERTRRRIKVQPCGQRAAVGQRGAVNERIPRVRVGEGIGRNRKAEGSAFGRRLVRQGRRQHGRMVHG